MGKCRPASPYNELLKENYPFSELVDQEVNTLIFPNLAAGNVAYNLLKEVVARCHRSHPAGVEKAGTRIAVRQLGKEHL